MAHPLVIQIIAKLKSEYSALPWYQQLFFPRHLAKALNQKKINIDEVCYQYHCSVLSKSWFHCLIDFGSSNLSKAYKQSLFADQPLRSVWQRLKSALGFWNRLSAAKQEIFRKSLAYENPYDFIVQPNHYITASAKPPLEEKIPSVEKQRFDLENRAFIELKTKLIDKNVMLGYFVRDERLGLKELSATFKSYAAQCKALEAKSHQQAQLSHEAIKILHYESYQYVEKKPKYIGCHCGARTYTWICTICHRPNFIETNKQVHSKRPVYVPDFEAREDARLLSLKSQSNLFKLRFFAATQEYQGLKQACLLLDSLENITSELTSLYHDLTDINKVSNKGQLMACLARHEQTVMHTVSKYPHLKKHQLMPSSEYANYRLASMFIQSRSSLFSRLDKHLKSYIAQFMIGPNFPKEDSAAIFAQYNP